MPSAEVITAKEQNGVSPNDSEGRVLRDEILTHSCRSNRRSLNRLELADQLFRTRLAKQPTIGDASNSGETFSRLRGIEGQKRVRSIQQKKPERLK